MECGDTIYFIDGEPGDRISRMFLGEARVISVGADTIYVKNIEKGECYFVERGSVFTSLKLATEKLRKCREQEREAHEAVTMIDRSE